MNPDDVAYRKSVRNMGAILATMVVVVFAALFVPYYLFQQHSVYQSSVTLDSPYGFAMHLTVNTSSVPSRGSVQITGWVNSTSSSIENITAANNWPVPQGRLWGKPCYAEWPIGIGVMQGRYTQDNYTLGTLVQLPQSVYHCPAQFSPPGSFAFEPYSSKALVVQNGGPVFWVFQTTVSFSRDTSNYQLPPGVYTAVLADEWGDVLTANFIEP